MFPLQSPRLAPLYRSGHLTMDSRWAPVCTHVPLHGIQVVSVLMWCLCISPHRGIRASQTGLNVLDSILPELLACMSDELCSTKLDLWTCISHKSAHIALFLMKVIFLCWSRWSANTRQQNQKIEVMVHDDHLSLSSTLYMLIADYHTLLLILSINHSPFYIISSLISLPNEFIWKRGILPNNSLDVQDYPTIMHPLYALLPLFSVLFHLTPLDHNSSTSSPSSLHIYMGYNSITLATTMVDVTWYLHSHQHQLEVSHD